MAERCSQPGTGFLCQAMGTELFLSGPYGRLPGLPFSGPLCFRCLCHGHFWQFCRLPVHCQGCDGLGNVQDCRVNVQGCWSFAQVVPNTAAPQMGLLASSRPVLQPFFGCLVCGDPVGAVDWRSYAFVLLPLGLPLWSDN